MSDVRVRCKFRLNSITESVIDRGYQEDGKWKTRKESLFTYKFSPVYSDNPESENKQFWDATPSGSFEFGSVKNQGFVIGRDYYFDITLAPE